MSHPSPGDLLELHFGELEEATRDRCAAHAAACPECGAFLAEIGLLEGALAPGADDAPPADGLHRVLARVEDLRPVKARRELGLRLLGPAFGAAALGAVAVHQGGLAAVIVLAAAGALVTLSLAPVLILEAQRRSS